MYEYVSCETLLDKNEPTTDTFEVITHEPEFKIENLDIILKEFRSLKIKGCVLMIGTPKE